MVRFSARLRIVLAGALCTPLSVSAQDGEQFDSYVGLGIRGRPAYEGASTNRGQVMPYLRWYGEHLFARTTQGILEAGVRTRPLSGVVLGAQLAYEDGRIADECEFLKAHHFEDIDPGASLGLLGSVDLSNRWLILLGLHVQRLEGDARNSPIVQDKSNMYANLGLAYRF